MGSSAIVAEAVIRSFEPAAKHRAGRWTAEMMGSAIRDYYTGKSYKQIAEGLKEEYDLPKEPSKATIYEWVRDYTDKALKQMGGHKAKTGGHWVADENAGGRGRAEDVAMERHGLGNPLHPGLPPDPQAGRQRSSCRPEKSGLGRRQAARDHHFRQAPVLHTLVEDVERAKEFAVSRLEQGDESELEGFWAWLEAECLEAEWRLNFFSRTLDICHQKGAMFYGVVGKLEAFLPEHPGAVIECFAKLTDCWQPAKVGHFC